MCVGGAFAVVRQRPWSRARPAAGSVIDRVHTALLQRFEIADQLRAGAAVDDDIVHLHGAAAERRVT